MKQPPKYNIAFFDVESAPNVGYTWEKWNQNVIEFEQPWYILAYAVKWAGEKKVTVKALPDFPSAYKKDPFDDSALMLSLWEVFDKADILVAHNARDFDIRKANSRFIVSGLTPPSPYKVVDTLLTARKHFRFNSNKLNDLARELFPDNPKLRKAETGGFQTWLGCMYGEPDAWAKMKKYNAQDVVLLEEVYYELLPWMDTHPNITLGTGISGACPNCGRTEFMERRGWRNLKSWRAQSWHCNPKKGGCGKWSQGPRQKADGIILTA